MHHERAQGNHGDRGISGGSLSPTQPAQYSSIRNMAPRLHIWRGVDPRASGFRACIHMVQVSLGDDGVQPSPVSLASPDKGCRILIAGLPHDMEEDELWSIAEDFGKVRRVEISNRMRSIALPHCAPTGWDADRQRDEVQLSVSCKHSTRACRGCSAGEFRRLCRDGGFGAQPWWVPDYSCGLVVYCDERSRDRAIDELHRRLMQDWYIELYVWEGFSDGIGWKSFGLQAPCDNPQALWRGAGSEAHGYWVKLEHLGEMNCGARSEALRRWVCDRASKCGRVCYLELFDGENGSGAIVKYSTLREQERALRYFHNAWSPQPSKVLRWELTRALPSLPYEHTGERKKGESGRWRKRARADDGAAEEEEGTKRRRTPTQRGLPNCVCWPSGEWANMTLSGVTPVCPRHNGWPPLVWGSPVRNEGAPDAPPWQ